MNHDSRTVVGHFLWRLLLMITGIRPLLIGLLSVVVVHSIHAAERFCPETIEVTQSIKHTPKGWSVDYEHRPHYLTTISVSDGHPSELAILKPDNGDSDELAYWTLDPHNTRPYWVTCSYLGTSAVLQKQLPQNISGCRAFMDQKCGVPDITCK